MTEAIKSPTCGYVHNSNLHLDKNEVHKKAFKEFIKLLLKLGTDHGADYVLLKITLDRDAGTLWGLEGKYQFLVNVEARLG